MPTLEPEKLDSSSPPKPTKNLVKKSPVKPVKPATVKSVNPVNPVKTKSENPVSSSSLPVEKLRRAARILTSLADAEATRTKIFYLLSRGPRTPGSLASEIGLSNSAISQHLIKIKAMGLIQSKVDAQSRIYSLVPWLSDETMELVKLILNRK